MGNRAAGFQRLLALICPPTRRGPASPRHAATVPIEVLEPLEARTLLSAVDPSSVISVNWNGYSGPVVANTYLVLTKAHSSGAATDIGDLAAHTGLSISNVQSLGGNGYYAFTSTESLASLQKWAAAQKNWVVALTPDFISHFTDITPTDPLFPSQYFLNNTDQSIASGNLFISPQPGIQGDDIRATQAWGITTGARDIVVADLDSGIDLNHPDLQANIFTNQKEVAGNGVDDDNDGFVDDVHGWNFVNDTNDPTDDEGHGTETAGVIGASGDNGIGVTGVNWAVSILPLKIGNADGSIDGVAEIKAIEYMTELKYQGVDIVAANASFGGPGFPYDQVTANAVAAAGKAGILFVAAAGNSGQNNDTNQFFPAKLSLNLSNVITVAATDNRNQLAAFSNYGPATTQLAAPGVQIVTTTPTFSVAQTLEGTTENYAAVDGTSFSAPIVSGIIALEASANRSATAAQLKEALLSGVTNVPALNAVVGTSGVANAFNAVRNIQNMFVRTDTATSGNWRGLYGSTGAFVAGDSLSGFPNFVTATFNNDIFSTLATTTSDPRAPLTIDGSNRVVSYFSSSTAESVDLSFTDAQIHRVSIYAVDFDNLHRNEVIQLVDRSTGTVRATVPLSNFQNGAYTTFDVSGNIRIVITNTGGQDAVFSGIFFDPKPVQETALVGKDTTTQGSWVGTYGSQGAYVVGQSTSFPAFVQVATDNVAVQKAKKATSAASKLQSISSASSRANLTYFTNQDQITVNLNFLDQAEHQVALYMVDGENKGRAQRVRLFNAAGLLLTDVDVTNFSKGQYVVFNITGAAKITIAREAGPSVVLSGIFFDAPTGAPAAFVSQNNTAGGNWHGLFGQDGAIVIGDNSSFLLDTTGLTDFSEFGLGAVLGAVPVSNAGTQVLKASTTAKAALEKVQDTSNRVSAGLVTQTFLDIPLNFTDEQTHRVSIYAADIDKKKRKEIVQVLDGRTGAVLAGQTLSNFQNGTYLTYDLRGDIVIRVTRLAGPNAVVNGIFFD